jgi:hypothetical protein
MKFATAFKATTFALTILLSTLTLASGSTIGNGGQGVFCKATNKIQLFDFFEASVLRGVHTDIGPSSLNYTQKVDLLLSRLERLDPVRAEFYRERFASFAGESRFVEKSELIAIPDANSPVIPHGCEIVQLAIQRKPNFPGEAYYLIDGDKWKLMNADQKAGLVLHEIIYREALEMGATNSEGARYLNSTLASGGFNQLKFADYNEILASLQFRRYTIFKMEKSKDVVFSSYIVGNLANGQVGAYCKSVLPDSRVMTLSEANSSYPALGSAIIDWFGTKHHNTKLTGVLLDESKRPVAMELTESSITPSPSQSASALCIWERN